MPFETVLSFAGHEIRSLVWVGDRLADPVGGWASVGMDGSTEDRRINFGQTFDRALMFNATTVIYTLLGTKGLVMPADPVAAREINRSYYCADAYEYPVAMGTLTDGTDVLIHCPDAYNRLAIETLDTGERLASATEAASDMFQSRLSISPGGRYLLTAGWIWHPVGVAAVYDLDAAVKEGATLDEPELLSWRNTDAEVGSACWIGDDEVLVSTDADGEALDGADTEATLRPGETGVWSIGQQRWIARHRGAGRLGTVHPLGDHVLCLFGHPRVIDPFTGEVLAEWPHLPTGDQTSSIISTSDIPLVAVDSRERRFAVAAGDSVTVVQL